jgi:hypothetical protein
VAPIHGKDGLVKIGANTGVSISAWRIDSFGSQLFDASPLQNTWETLQDGLRSASGAILCDWDEADSNVQGALLTAAEGGTTATLLLYVNATKYFSIPAYITLGAEVNVDGTVKRTFNFRSSGTVSFN